MAAVDQVGDVSFETAGDPTNFTVKDIFYEMTLEELVSRGIRFNIIGHNTQNYAMFDLMPVDISEDDLFHLKEDINEVIQYTDAKFEKKPKKLDVVLAKKTGTSGPQLYHRCFITNVFFDEKFYAEVYWIDVGGTGTVELNDLKPVDKDIMSHPRLAYTVILQNACQISNYILLEDFEKTILKLRNVKCTVELGEQNEIGGKLYSKQKVKLTFADSSNTVIDLRDEINKLKKWDWETFSNLKWNDDELFANSIWGTEFRTNFKDEFPISYSLSPHVGRFSAAVSRVVPDEKNAKLANLRIILLDDQKSYNYFNVLHHQLERYTANIKKSNFYPSVKEPLLFKLDDKEEYKKTVKCLGRWMRAIHIDKNILYLLDVDDFIPVGHIPEDDYDMRPLYGEFFKVPTLSIDVRPTDGQGPMELAAAEKIFKKGKRYHFSITTDKDATGSPYEVRYSEVLSTLEEKLTIDSFLTSYEEI